MLNIKKQYEKTVQKLKKLQVFLSIRKKVLVFSIIAMPITSAGAGATIFIDNQNLDLINNPQFINGDIVDLDEKIVVNFTNPIQNTKGYENVVALYPQTSTVFTWNETKTLLIITPQTTWLPKTRYSLALPHNTKLAKETASTIFSFETVAYPKVSTTNIMHNNYVSEGEDVLITFDRDISNEFDVQAAIRPIIETEQTYDPETRTLRVHIIKEKDYKKNAHSLTLFAKHVTQSRSQFHPIDLFTFNALTQKPESWPQQHTDRLDIAKASTAPKVTKGKYIDVNTDAQITTLFENGAFVRNFVSSTGAMDTPTPHGEFQIHNKDPYALSEMFQVYLPYWMAFTEDGKYGFHDLIVWPEGHEERPEGGKESEASIGNAVSPGCVRHDNEDSLFIYEWSDIGTKVVIY